MKAMAGIKHARSPVLSAFDIDSLPFKRLRISSLDERDTQPPSFSLSDETSFPFVPPPQVSEGEPIFLTRGKRTQDDAMDIDSDEQAYKVDIDNYAKKRRKQKAREESRALIRMLTSAATFAPMDPVKIDPKDMKIPKRYLPVLQHIVQHRLSPLEGLEAYRRLKTYIQHGTTKSAGEEESLDAALSVAVRKLDKSQWLSFCQDVYTANGGGPNEAEEFTPQWDDREPCIVELSPEEAAQYEREEERRRHNPHAIPSSIVVEEVSPPEEDVDMEY